MRLRAIVKRHRERRAQGGLISKLAGFAPFSIFLWLMFGIYWFLNILMIAIMPYCTYDLFWVGSWPWGTSYLQLMIWIVALSAVIMVLSILTEKRWRNAALSLFFQSFMLVGTALHVGAQYGWYYPDSFPGRTLAGIVEATRPELLLNETVTYVERTLPPEVERLREAAYETIRTGPNPDRAHDIIIRTDETFELVLMPAAWRNGNKQASEDFGYELALRKCVADFTDMRERTIELWYDDTIMYVEYVGNVPFDRYYRTSQWGTDWVLYEKYPEFFDALDAQ